MSGNIPIMALHALLALLLVIAAVGDIRSREIPNWLTGAIAVLAIPAWFATGLSLWPHIAIQLGAGLLVFAAFAAFFAMGVMGGGDVKLIGALALWFAPYPLLSFLFTMSVLGGVLTLAMWGVHKARRATDKLEVPYGVAISAAALWSLSERYLNHFG